MRCTKIARAVHTISVLHFVFTSLVQGSGDSETTAGTAPVGITLKSTVHDRRSARTSESPASVAEALLYWGEGYCFPLWSSVTKLIKMIVGVPLLKVELQRLPTD